MGELLFCVSHLIKRTKRKSNKRTRQAHASQLTHKIRRSIRTAVLVVSIGEPRGHWIIHELAISIELIVGVHLLLRIATTGITVVVPQNPKRTRILPQEPSPMQPTIHIVGYRISRTTL